MTLNNDVTSQKCIILSENDKRITGLSYKPGDKFIFIDDDLSDYSAGLAMYLRDRPVIVEIESIVIEAEKGELIYRLKFMNKLHKLFSGWVVDEEFLNKGFKFLGRDSSNIRFIDNE